MRRDPLTARGGRLLARLREPGWKVRWSVWLLYVGLWSAALLTPHPIRAARMLLPTGCIFLSAKLLHFTAYTVLGLLSAWQRVPSPFRVPFYALLFAHGAATAILQRFVPLRHPSVRDGGIDCLGLVVGLGLSWGLSLQRWERNPALRPAAPPSVTPPVGHC
jgi:VanZ family protein